MILVTSINRLQFLCGDASGGPNRRPKGRISTKILKKPSEPQKLFPATWQMDICRLARNLGIMAESCPEDKVIVNKAKELLSMAKAKASGLGQVGLKFDIVLEYFSN